MNLSTAFYSSTTPNHININGYNFIHDTEHDTEHDTHTVYIEDDGDIIATVELDTNTLTYDDCGEQATTTIPATVANLSTTALVEWVCHSYLTY